ncbi:U1 small nuclear ribonucleoprotein 70 kDa-like [Impatiens glandulifera]|uniref:U1 small nuclear ribonucleoprotein 70 kDa-like n=1 Tax=Impatiens glandulifera TaxID=253017 RepID=UPI001FB14068|nr:U1 small nuclear ribonucleoprotein 70 kDa-like [Impatiens glandulifera]
MTATVPYTTEHVPEGARQPIEGVGGWRPTSNVKAQSRRESVTPYQNLLAQEDLLRIQGKSSRDTLIVEDPLATAPPAHETHGEEIDVEAEEFVESTFASMGDDKEAHEEDDEEEHDSTPDPSSQAAYKQADGTKIDNRRVIVDLERGRTVPNWKPRRLGGGLGTTRIGGEDVNQKQLGGSGWNTFYPVSRFFTDLPVSHNIKEQQLQSGGPPRARDDRHAYREKSREKGRDREGDREKSRERSSEKPKDRDELEDEVEGLYEHECRRRHHMHYEEDYEKSDNHNNECGGARYEQLEQIDEDLAGSRLYNDKLEKENHNVEIDLGMVEAKEEEKGVAGGNKTTSSVRKEGGGGGSSSQVERETLTVDINESAESFIKKFKTQLLIQRLESIENYEQMMMINHSKGF